MLHPYSTEKPCCPLTLAEPKNREKRDRPRTTRRAYCFLPRTFSSPRRASKDQFLVGRHSHDVDYIRAHAVLHLFDDLARLVIFAVVDQVRRLMHFGDRLIQRQCDQNEVNVYVGQFQFFNRAFFVAIREFLFASAMASVLGALAV